MGLISIRVMLIAKYSCMGDLPTNLFVIFAFYFNNSIQKKLI